MKFEARAKNGGLVFQSDSQRDEFRDFVKKNDGVRLKIEQITPESEEQRGFFEGAIVPLVTYYQEGMDRFNSRHLRQVRDWLKIEFNGEVVVVDKKAHKIALSTKGKLNDGFIERVIDYLVENYGIDPAKVLNPEAYKRFRDEIYPYSNYEDFIAYMKDIKLLK
jgi:hypothetical protein